MRLLKPIASLLAVSTFVLSGCSPTPPPQVAQNNNPSPRDNSSNPSDDEGAGAQGAQAPAQPAAPEPQYRMIGGKMRRLPVAAAGDGAPVSSQVTPPPAAAQNNPNSGGAAGGAGMVAGMANGLFPVLAGGGSGTSMVAGFGALFPTGDAGSSNSSSSPRRDETSSPSTAVTPPVSTNSIPSFMDAASAAFARGDATNGHRALYAYALLNPSAFDEFPLHYVPQLKEPRWFLNWGIGVQYSPVKEFSGFPPLIGDEVETATKSRPGSGADILGVDPMSGSVSGISASKSKYGNVNVGVPIGMLFYYTGDYGVRLYKRMNDRREGEFFGKVLANLPEHQPGAGEGGVANQAQSSGNAPPVSRHAHRNLPVAAAGDGPATPPPNSDTTPAGRGNSEPGRPASVAKTSVLQRWSVKEEAKEPGSVTGLIMPGVISVGEGKSEVLIERAKRLGLDALIIMEVKVLKEKATFYSSTVLRVYDLKSDAKKSVVNAKALRNNLVAKDREKTRESNDPVELELDKVFREFVDENFKVQPLEGWDAAQAAEYVDNLIEQKVDPLRAATETLGLYRMGILQADKCKSALDELLGGAGTVLMSGKDSDKQLFLQDFVRDTGGAMGGIR